MNRGFTVIKTVSQHASEMIGNFAKRGGGDNTQLKYHSQPGEQHHLAKLQHNQPVVSFVTLA
jgi:hypothetical protein